MPWSIAQMRVWAIIKRTMYGKCNRELLEAKLCYMRQERNG